MDWFLYDRDLHHERVKSKQNAWLRKGYHLAEEIVPSINSMFHLVVWTVYFTHFFRAAILWNIWEGLRLLVR